LSEFWTKIGSLSIFLVENGLFYFWEVVNVTTCWLLDFHVLTDDRPASSTPVCKAAVRPMRGFVDAFLVTKCCRLDAGYIRQ